MSNIANNRVLVVEDDPAIRRLMTTHFRKNGFQVEYAMSAEEVASDEAYDLVVTDVHLPGQSGVELARRIRHTRPEQKVVFMTGDADASVAREAFRTGAAGYLLKPFEFFELDAIVRKALSIRPVSPPPLVLTTEHDRHSQRMRSARIACAITTMLGLAFLAGAALLYITQQAAAAL